jgi:hypothetical protein
MENQGKCENYRPLENSEKQLNQCKSALHCREREHCSVRAQHDKNAALQNSDPNYNLHRFLSGCHGVVVRLH